MQLTAPAIDPGTTAWVLASTALMLLMPVGVGLFYGGMVQAKHVLSILMQTMSALAVVTVVWVLVGFSLAYGDGNRILGGLAHIGLGDLDRGISGLPGLVVPPAGYAGFHMLVAAIAVAFITGATADRWRYGPYLVFVALWTVLVYVPVARWVFHPDGWIARLGVLDAAGGVVVHVNAGAAAAAMALLLGRRPGWPHSLARPHNLPMVVLGAGLLSFGWLGLTAGSVLRMDGHMGGGADGRADGATSGVVGVVNGSVSGVAAVALVATVVAAAAGMLSWVAMERIRYGKSTTLGAASGAVAGLVAVTPGAGYVTPLAALVTGAVAGVACALLVNVKTWIGLDDSLDVAAVHLGGGMLGTLLVGLFASSAVNPDGGDGMFYGGGYAPVGLQFVGVVAVAGYSFVVTLGIGALLERLLGNRVTASAYQLGIDLAQHGEVAYHVPAPVRVTPVAGSATRSPAGPVEASVTLPEANRQDAATGSAPLRPPQRPAYGGTTPQGKGTSTS